MEAAAQRAAEELAQLKREQPEAVTLVCAWWQRHYRAAGHKRLGRVLISQQPAPQPAASGSPTAGAEDDD
jgi:hypothetical protein